MLVTTLNHSARITAPHVNGAKHSACASVLQPAAIHASASLLPRQRAALPCHVITVVPSTSAFQTVTLGNSRVTVWTILGCKASAVKLDQVFARGVDRKSPIFKFALMFQQTQTANASRFNRTCARARMQTKFVTIVISSALAPTLKIIQIANALIIKVKWIALLLVTTVRIKIFALKQQTPTAIA